MVVIELLEKKSKRQYHVAPSIFLSIHSSFCRSPMAPSAINATIAIKQNRTGIARKQSNCTPSHGCRPIGTVYSHTACAVDSAVDRTKVSFSPSPRLNDAKRSGHAYSPGVKSHDSRLTLGLGGTPWKQTPDQHGERSRTRQDVRCVYAK